MKKLTKNLVLITLTTLFSSAIHADQYLVVGSGGPGFNSPQQALAVLKNGILPTFDALMKLERNKIITAGGLPVGDRSFTFILEASSNNEVDQILRDLPAWGVLNWEVTPLQSFTARSNKEKDNVALLTKMVN